MTSPMDWYTYTPALFVNGRIALTVSEECVAPWVHDEDDVEIFPHAVCGVGEEVAHSLSWGSLSKGGKQGLQLLGAVQSRNLPRGQKAIDHVQKVRVNSEVVVLKDQENLFALHLQNIETKYCKK